LKNQLFCEKCNLEVKAIKYTKFYIWVALEMIGNETSRK
jgi:hypothetical protein